MCCLYLCSNNIASQLGVDSEYILHNHGIHNHKKRVYIFPLDNTNTTINPDVFSKIKNELNLIDLLLVDRIYNELGIVNVLDHINRTGQSFLRGKTPHGELPTFPDVSKIYNNNEGKIFASVGEKKPININTIENVILSEWIALIAPVWHYIGVNIKGVGVDKNINSINSLTK
tara:strand:- start:525 stop:1043 length:519 start_codon:yes stop_codon:yes gene_type:complete